MSTITVPRKIIVKAIVTDSFKDGFKAQLESLRKEMADNVDKIKTEESRLLLNVGVGLSQNELNSARSKLAYDRQQQEAGMKEIDEKLKEMETLKEGSIYPYTQLDSFVDIQEGDNLFEKLSPGEITIRDGIAISIKE
ncbi:MAG: YlqD family protein [Caldisericia bacterium]|nr:YlqD family protein [Caldisericia bacterium]MDD4613899.1 YlqD family protein [Caldisericia bacterium]